MVSARPAITHWNLDTSAARMSGHRHIPPQAPTGGLFCKSSVKSQDLKTIASRRECTASILPLQVEVTCEFRSRPSVVRSSAPDSPHSILAIVRPKIGPPSSKVRSEAMKISLPPKGLEDSNNETSANFHRRCPHFPTVASTLDSCRRFSRAHHTIPATRLIQVPWLSAARRCGGLSATHVARCIRAFVLPHQHAARPYRSAVLRCSMLVLRRTQNPNKAKERARPEKGTCPRRKGRGYTMMTGFASSHACQLAAPSIREAFERLARHIGH